MTRRVALVLAGVGLSAPLLAAPPSALAAAHPAASHLVAAHLVASHPATATSAAAQADTAQAAAGPATPAAAVLKITTIRLPGAEATRAYRATLRSTGGAAPLRWSLVSGALPVGLTLSSAGVVAGRPVAAGAGRFTVRVRDRLGRVATKYVQLPVVPYGGLVLSLTRVGPAVLGSTPSATVTAVGRWLGSPTSTYSGAGCELYGDQVAYTASWGRLSISGQAERGTPVRITSWTWSGASVARIRTDDGHGIGATLTAIKATYPAMTVDTTSPLTVPDYLAWSGSRFWVINHTTKKATTLFAHPQFCE